MTLQRAPSTRIELTLALPNGGRLEPIDIELIETIRTSRSISNAGRVLGISYRKAWRMADELNRTFSSRVIETFPGRRDGGAEVTVFGERLVALFRSMERRTASSTAAALGEIVSSLDDSFEPEVTAEEKSA